MKIVYDERLMKSMILFENLTNVKVKDICFLKDAMLFVIEKGSMFKALGKNGNKIKKLENLFKKKVKLIEINEDIKKFTSNLIYPIKANDIEFKDGILTISLDDMRAKGLLIGRERKNLRELKELLSRYFKLENIMVR